MTDDRLLDAWLLAAQRGERNALRSLVRATQRELLLLAGYLTEQDTAESVVERTYVRAVLPTAARDTSMPVRLWLLALTRQAAAEAGPPRGTAEPRAEAAAEAPAQTPARTPHDAPMAALLARLDPPRRTAFVLTQLLGLGYADAASVCACTVAQVRSRVAAARDTLLADTDSARPRRRKA